MKIGNCATRATLWPPYWGCKNETFFCCFVFVCQFAELQSMVSLLSWKNQKILTPHLKKLALQHFFQAMSIEQDWHGKNQYTFYRKVHLLVMLLCNIFIEVNKAHKWQISGHKARYRTLKMTGYGISSRRRIHFSAIVLADFPIRYCYLIVKRLCPDNTMSTEGDQMLSNVKSNAINQLKFSDWTQSNLYQIEFDWFVCNFSIWSRLMSANNGQCLSITAILANTNYWRASWITRPTNLQRMFSKIASPPTKTIKSKSRVPSVELWPTMSKLFNTSPKLTNSFKICKKFLTPK